ncbi:MAG: DUF1246 domain-containing protein [Fluviibacter sp.]
MIDGQCLSSITLLQCKTACSHEQAVFVVHGVFVNYFSNNKMEQNGIPHFGNRHRICTIA